MRLADLSRLAAELDGCRRAEPRWPTGLALPRAPGRAAARRQARRHPSDVRLPRFPAPIVSRNVLGAGAICEAHDDRRRHRERQCRCHRGRRHRRLGTPVRQVSRSTLVRWRTTFSTSFWEPGCANRPTGFTAGQDVGRRRRRAAPRRACRGRPRPLLPGRTRAGVHRPRRARVGGPRLGAVKRQRCTPAIRLAVCCWLTSRNGTRRYR